MAKKQAEAPQVTTSWGQAHDHGTPAPAGVELAPETSLDEVVVEEVAAE